MKYCNIQWNSETKKKEVTFGDTWGAMPKSEANGSFTQTGSGLVVVDVDRKDDLPSWLSGCSPTIETARGYHYYFKSDDAFRTMSDFEDGVDIRGERGVVFDGYWGESKHISYEKVGKVGKLPVSIKGILPPHTKKERLKKGLDKPCLLYTSPSPRDS